MQIFISEVYYVKINTVPILFIFLEGMDFKCQSSSEDITLMSRKRIFNLRFFYLLICFAECEAVNETTQTTGKVKTVF